MRLIMRLALLIVVMFAMVPCVQAQSAPEAPPNLLIKKRQLLVQPRDANGKIIVTPFFEDPVLWARDQQQNFYISISSSLHQLKSGSSIAAAWTLLLVGFGYGVFHAAGPGHGKVVISSWLLATENDLRRGLLVAFLSSLFQALTAITVVSVLLLLVASAGAVVRDITRYLESASYAMICALGLYMIYLAARGWFKKPASNEINFEIINTHYDAGHVHDANCGHAHAPTPQEVRGEDWSLKKALTLSFAVGLRPCTGAILVLLSANAMGLFWAGVASTLAMGFGVFLTVAAIATITVYGKNIALRFSGGDNRRATLLVNALRLAGGLVVAFMGAIMFLGSFGNNSGMM
jgi:nickel/cobalt transporter (NicO) family protein